MNLRVERFDACERSPELRQALGPAAFPPWVIWGDPASDTWWARVRAWFPEFQVVLLAGNEPVAAGWGVTGANRSLGLETARRLIDAGHTIYAGVRDPNQADDVRALGAHVLRLDVTDTASVEAAIAQLPALDVLVNNAGVLGASFTVEDLDADAMTGVLDTNVVGIVRVTQAALRLLDRSPNLVIVNVASGVGWPRFLQGPQHDEYPVKAVPYAASKAAVVALTVQYAKNLPNMRVNASDPGYTATDFNGHSGHQTVTEGTDATVALATLDQSGPTGQFHARTGVIAY